MKPLRYAVTAAILLSTTLAAAASDAQKAFDALKALEGTWEGKNNQGQTLTISFRATADGSALMNEIHGVHKDNMITMFHLDGDRLLLTHYCSAGNQPRMKASFAPDGKSISFDFVDATNLSSPEAGHMNRVVFAIPDANHHSEEWTFLDHGKQMKETFALERRR